MTAPAKPNAELAWRVLDTARKHGEHFDMSDWGDSPDGSPVSLVDLTEPACGTTACLAGWTVALAGYSVNSHASVYDAAGGYVGDATDIASEMLGISADQAEDLFYASTDGVERTVEEIFGPRPDGAS